MADRLQEFGHNFQIKSVVCLMTKPNFIEQVIDILDEIVWEGSRACSVEIEMTLTSPNCPVAESLPREVETKVSNLAGVYECKVNIVFEPTWNTTYMSEEARLELGML